MSKSHVNAGDAGDDIELVARAREGDHAAFEQLVHRHQAAVHRAALSAVGSPADADDVAQEAFLLAYQRLRGFRGEATFKTWMLTITWNQAMNHRRKAGRWWRRFVSVDTGEAAPFESTQVASPSGTPEDLAAHGQMRDDIRRGHPRAAAQAARRAAAGAERRVHVRRNRRDGEVARPARSSGASRKRAGWSDSTSRRADIAGML